jgi:hypothetical protein
MAPALLTMLDAGKIDFDAVRRGKKREKAFAAKANPMTSPSFSPLNRGTEQGTIRIDLIRTARWTSPSCRPGKRDTVASLTLYPHCGTKEKIDSRIYGKTF